MSWQRLAESKAAMFYAGTVFRFPAKWPYEEIVDLMLFSDGVSAVRELRVVVTSGYKCGLVNIIAGFPREAYVEGHLAVSASLLAKHWNEWVYEDCDVEHVFVLESYPVPAALPNA